MSLTLAVKELREHAAVLTVAVLLGAAILTGLLIQAENVLGGRFVGLVRFSLVFAPLLAMVLANRLLVREYSGRTQLFLETLPIGRLRVFATKWLLGAALTLTIAAIATLIALRRARRGEIVEWQDAQGPVLAVLVFWLTVWAFAALGGMLGRYRYVVWAAVGTVIYFATTVAGIPLFELPVVRLLGADVEMVRGTPEAAAFARALGIAAACTAGATALALLGSGGIASTLARRMTARERVFALVALLAVFSVAAMLEPQPEQPPFAITEGERVQGRHAAVGVMPTFDLDAEAARRLAGIVAADVDALVDALHLDSGPPVFLLPQQGLDRHALQLAALSGAHGVIMKMAPDAPTDLVRTLVAHSVLTDATLGRGMRDDRHALLDGLAAYWALRDDAARREIWWLRAASIETPVTAHALTAWGATSERLGECRALALAFNAVAAAADELGHDALLEMLRPLFAMPIDDARVVFERSPAALLAAHGWDWQRLATAAEAARQNARQRHAAALAARPRIDAAVEWHDSAEAGIEIETRVEGVDAYFVYYTQLGPWTADVGGLPRIDVRGARTIVPLSPPHGGRVLVIAETEDAALDCPVRVLAERLVLL